MNYEPEIDTIIELWEMDYVWPDPIEDMMQKDLSRVLLDCLDGLTPRESKVIKLRFGLDRDKDHTLEQVAKVFDVTRERIRQIEAKALRKLRHPIFSDWIRQAADDHAPVIPKKVLTAIKRPKYEPKTTWFKPGQNAKSKPKPKPKKAAVLYPVRNFVIPKADGWVDGNEFTPKYEGVYERIDKGFVAFSKWDGCAWLKGSENYQSASWVDSDDISKFQTLDWRTPRG